MGGIFSYSLKEVDVSVNTWEMNCDNQVWKRQLIYNFKNTGLTTTKCIFYTHENEMAYFCTAMFFFYTLESIDTIDFATPEGSTKWYNKHNLTDCNI